MNHVETTIEQSRKYFERASSRSRKISKKSRCISLSLISMQLFKKRGLDISGKPFCHHNQGRLVRIVASKTFFYLKTPVRFSLRPVGDLFDLPY